MSEVLKPPAFVWTMPAYADYAHDGDTVVCHVLVHPNEGGELHDVHVRIEGINAPELNTAEGKVSRDYAEDLLQKRGQSIMLVTRKRDKYGRFLGRIIFADGSDFSELMIQAGQAVPYMT